MARLGPSEPRVPLRDFAAVALLNRSNMFLVVNPSFPAQTVSDLVAMAKQKPGELQYVNPGLGTPPHLAALAFLRATATTMAPDPSIEVQVLEWPM